MKPMQYHFLMVNTQKTKEIHLQSLTIKSESVTLFQMVCYPNVVNYPECQDSLLAKLIMLGKLTFKPKLWPRNAQSKLACYIGPHNGWVPSKSCTFKLSYLSKQPKVAKCTAVGKEVQLHLS